VSVGTSDGALLGGVVGGGGRFKIVPLVVVIGEGFGREGRGPMFEGFVGRRGRFRTLFLDATPAEGVGGGGGDEGKTGERLGPGTAASISEGKLALPRPLCPTRLYTTRPCLTCGSLLSSSIPAETYWAPLRSEMAS
jgi:hypothetical protein